MKNIITAILISLVLIGGALIFFRGNVREETENKISANNVTIKDGVQIVEINARGGYYPRQSVAKAGIPTILRFNTNGTFDCSSSIRIPSLNVSKNLPISGATDIELSNPAAGALKGFCAMGMYSFEVVFES